MIIAAPSLISPSIQSVAAELGQDDGVGLGNHRKRFHEVGELSVAHPGCLGQVGWLHLDSGAALLIPARGSRTDDEVSTGGGVLPQPSQKGVVGDQQACDNEHRELICRGGWLEKSAAIQSDDLGIVDEPCRHSRIKGAAIEGVEDAVV
jgi:hypothetical protein